MRSSTAEARYPEGRRPAGSAQDGIDHQWLSGEVAIPARKKSATLLRPIGDGIPEGGETIKLAVLTARRASPASA